MNSPSDIGSRDSERDIGTSNLPANTQNNESVSPVWLDTNGNPLSLERSDQLSRASKAYADVLAILNPGPEVSASLMREQFAEQVANPGRYHQIDEAENTKGLHIGDHVTRTTAPSHVLTVTSIVCRVAGTEPSIHVHVIAPDTYGGWTPLASIDKIDTPASSRNEKLPPQPRDGRQPEIAPEPAASNQPDESGVRSWPEQGKDTGRNLRNQEAIAAATEWGFDSATLRPNEHGWIVPRFAHIEQAVEFTENGAAVTIHVARAPNGKWAAGSTYSEGKIGRSSLPFPSQACTQHADRGAAIKAELADLKERISAGLFVKVVMAAKLRENELGLAKHQPGKAPNRAGRDKATTTAQNTARPGKKQNTGGNGSMSDGIAPHGPTPAAIEDARRLLVRYIDESGDLFGSGGISLLAGPAHASKRADLLALLKGAANFPEKSATLPALRDAFYTAAEISGPSEVENETRLSAWARGEPANATQDKDDKRVGPDASHQQDGNATCGPLIADAAGSAPQPVEEDGKKSPAAEIPGGLTLTPARKIADWVSTRIAQSAAFTSKELFEVADAAFGGTQATGAYAVKDAYDAMEAGVNLAVMAANITPDGTSLDALRTLEALTQILHRLPTQTRRTAEMDEFQQFSTPPTIAFLAAWAARIAPGETMLEPSAGIAGLAMYGVLAGAEVVVNELSSRRAVLLKQLLPRLRLFSENAEQLNNVLPPDVRPTLILMNPPFSATAGRLPGQRTTEVGARHIEQALKRLAPGGRLVAIVGQGMAMDRPAFKTWWGEIKATYNVRANIGIDGKHYTKYGTTFDNQLLVIDKTGATLAHALSARVTELTELPPLLEDIRNDRPAPVPANPDRQRRPAEPDRQAAPAGRLARVGRAVGADPDALGPVQRAVHPAAVADAPRPGPGRSDDRPAGANGTGQGDGLPDQPGERAGWRNDPDDGSDGAGGDTGSGGIPAAGSAVQQHGRDGAVEAGAITIGQLDPGKNTEALSDAIYEQYAPQRLAIAGAHPHPGKLVQSAAMAAVEPPAPTYVPNLPGEIVERGLLSLAQLEAVVYAGQAHEQHLPNGQRRGFFIGDGTGVGKGRSIACIILDNWRSGRRKAVWVSEKAGLMRDARRDLAGIGGDGSILFAQGRIKLGDTLPDRNGVLFASYALLAAGQKTIRANAQQAAAKTRLQQLTNWLGADFDGVIALDESHNMANANAKRGARGIAQAAAKALAGIALQEALPNARIVYVSATGATEVSNLTYATRLGLWGEGTPFAKAADFIGAIDAGGVAAMELVSRDMKAMGAYLARSLSFDGVTYERLEHTLTPLQTDIYNELAGIWQTVLQNVNAALSDTGQGRNGPAKSAALSRFWGAHQRFFNQIITSLQMPTVIAQARSELDKGHAVVMQLVNTNEAAQERQLADLGAAGAEVEEMDFTPRQNLIDYVKNGFPVQQYEDFKGDDGNLRSRAVVDANGKPVFNKDMEAQRDALVQTLIEIRVPDNPIDTIVNAFGPQLVAEVTGRSRRFIMERNADGDVKPVEQKRPPSAAVADAEAFMEDKKRVLVFSDAGGTGYSFHADLTRPNQRKRIHYLIQPGWRAEKAVQGMGRTHRTNEASQPHYILPTTNLEAQRRFISSIARRLDQLGALTKGQRQTGSQGLFSASDNLESDYARRALRTLFNDMYQRRSPLDFAETAHAMGFNGLIDAKTGALNESKLPTIPQFLNRLLSLKTFEQDRVFGEFFLKMEYIIAMAKQQGNYDQGVETIRAQSILKLRDEVVHTDARTGAETRFIELALHHPTRLTPFADLPIRGEGGAPLDNFMGFFRNEKTGKILALQKNGLGTNEHGVLITRGRQFAPTGPVRYVDNIDHVTAAASGGVLIKRRDMAPIYAGQPFSEAWSHNGRSYAEHSAAAADALEKGGLAALDYMLTMRGIPAARRVALERVVERIKGNLTEKEVERQVKAYTRLTEPDARQAWEAELAAAPKTTITKEHLITGALLPIWDRIPGSPRVIRTQTDDGERLLGRTVAPAMLKQTLKNLGVGSDVDKLPADQILARILTGDKAVLANGWEIRTVRVSHDTRIEIDAAHLPDGDRRVLQQQGAFCERIQWRERVFIPTGEDALTVLARIIKAKPVVELFDKPHQDDSDGPAFSHSAPSALKHAGTGKNGAGPMTLAQLGDAAAAIARKWPNAPRMISVQSVTDLPFSARPNAQGAFHRNTIYLVADNIADEKELQFVVAHEALGHAGLRALLNEQELWQEMNRLRSINPELDREAHRLARAHGITLTLATEEALADRAGEGRAISGFQSLVIKLQRALRKVGLVYVADWLEGKTQAETMALLRRAKESIAGQNQAPGHSTVQSGPMFVHRKAAADPYGLRMFGVASLDQLRPAYRDTGHWRPVPALMSDPGIVRAIRVELETIERASGDGIFCLDENGNIALARWAVRSNERETLKALIDLADRYGLGVLAAKSAYSSGIDSDRLLREYDFEIIGPSITKVATGRDGPPNQRTYMRKPNGAPLFSHGRVATQGRDSPYPDEIRTSTLSRPSPTPMPIGRPKNLRSGNRRPQI